jgi:RNA polymerase sigma-70 factor (ECF subfamily)
MNPWYDLHPVTGDFAQTRSEPERDPLLQSLADGDARALTEVYQEHHVAVRAFASRLLGDEAAAEDMVQEAFVALPSAVQRFRGETSLRSFVIGVALNYARHFVRAAARRRQSLARLSREPAGRPTTPDDALTRQQLGDALFSALDQLPLEQRIAFVLCVVEERSSDEVARIVHAPSPTVRARVQAAKKKLRQLLEESGFR